MAKADTRKVPQPVIKDLYDFSDESLSQLKTYFEQSGIRIPVSQLVGSATVPNPATVTPQHIVDALVALGILSQNP